MQEIQLNSPGSFHREPCEEAGNIWRGLEHVDYLVLMICKEIILDNDAQTNTNIRYKHQLTDTEILQVETHTHTPTHTCPHNTFHKQSKNQGLNVLTNEVKYLFFSNKRSITNVVHPPQEVQLKMCALFLCLCSVGLEIFATLLPNFGTCLKVRLDSVISFIC